MEFSLEFEEANSTVFFFDEQEYSILERDEEELPSIFGTIKFEDDTVIGRVSGYLLYNDKDFWDRCDCGSTDCEAVASAICKKDGSISKRYLSDKGDWEQIFILDRIEINDSYRNNGVASRIMENLPRLLQYQFVAGSTIFLNASDYNSASKYGFDSDEYKNGSQRLVSFYEKFGYKTIKGNVMGWKEQSDL